MEDDELLWMGVDLYNSAHYFEAHEVWEEVWLRAEREDRHFYQGLIQITAAFVHLQRNEYPGLVKLLQEGLNKLVRYPDTYKGLDLTALIRGAKACRDRALALGERRLADFDNDLIPLIPPK